MDMGFLQQMRARRMHSSLGAWQPRVQDSATERAVIRNNQTRLLVAEDRARVAASQAMRTVMHHLLVELVSRRQHAAYLAAELSTRLKSSRNSKVLSLPERRQNRIPIGREDPTPRRSFSSRLLPECQRQFY